MKKLYSYIIILMALFALQANAMRNDSIRFSLLTCSPGTEIYSLFGHTAIRYQNFTQKKDLVFNYGMFSFSTPNFYYRFVKGDTFYQLGINYYDVFEAEYFMRGSKVYQQVLNLTSAEKYRLEELLMENYRPENRVYRYNYFYDNCTTRARDRIEESIDGRVVYDTPADSVKTFREIVHEFTDGYLWSEFGIDLCLGAQADAPIGIRSQMFSPLYMLDFANNAYILNNDGSKRPLVTGCEVVVDAHSEEIESEFPLSPMQCSLLFLLLNIVVAYLQVSSKRIFIVYDIVLYLFQGIAGCIISFLFFVSVHPTVGSNWMILLLNPLPLLYLPIMIYNDIKGRKDIFHIINSAYLTLFIILMPFIPQEFNFSVLPLSAGFMVNAISHVLVYRK